MDFELRKKALSRLSRSDSPDALATLRDEFDAALAVLESDTEYDRLEGALSILEIIADRFSAEATAALVRFFEAVEGRALTHPRAGIFADEMDKYQNARTLIARAIEVLLQLRYLETLPVLRALMQLARHQAEGIRQKAINGARTLASYDLRVFYGDKRQPGIGASPQLLIVDELQGLKDQALLENFQFIVEVSNSLLSPTIESTTWTYKTLTISQGATPAVGGVADVRKKTVNLLKRIYGIVQSVSQKLHVIGVLNAATRRSRADKLDGGTASMLVQDTVDVLRFFEKLVESESLQVLEKLESNAYWIHFHTANAEIEAEALRIKEALDRHIEYQIYKTLIGFEGIFGVWTKSHAQSEFEDKERFRNEKAREFAASINPNTYATWRARILEYAKTESSDLATFPILYKFLEHFAATQPALAHQLVVEDADKLTRFLIALLRGLWGAAQDKQRGMLSNWIDEGRYLRHIAAQFIDNELFDIELVRKVLEKAAQLKDEVAISTVVSVAVSNYNAQRRDLITQLFSPALAYLTEAKSTRWIFDFWFRRQVRQLIPDLSEKDLRLVLKNLLLLKEIDFHAEEILYFIAARDRALVLDLLCDRLRLEAAEEREKDFDAIPYSFHKLQEPLSKDPNAVINAVSALYDGNYGMFVLRGARLVRIIFPTFPAELSEVLLRLVQDGGERNLEIVLAILRSYEGPTTIHEISKALIRQLPDDSRLRTEVAVALQTTGVVTGEYGFADAYQRKVQEIQPWLNDPDPRVQEFARSYISDLEKQINSERKRATEEIALRKQQYGE